MAQFVIDRLEVVVVDQQQGKGNITPVGPRKGGVETASKLPCVDQAGEAVGGRLLPAALVAKRIGDRNGRASGQCVDGEQVLVGEGDRGQIGRASCRERV